MAMDEKLDLFRKVAPAVTRPAATAAVPFVARPMGQVAQGASAARTAAGAGRVARAATPTPVRDPQALTEDQQAFLERSKVRGLGSVEARERRERAAEEAKRGPRPGLRERLKIIDAEAKVRAAEAAAKSRETVAETKAGATTEAAQIKAGANKLTNESRERIAASKAAIDKMELDIKAQGTQTPEQKAAIEALKGDQRQQQEIIGLMGYDNNKFVQDFLSNQLARTQEKIEQGLQGVGEGGVETTLGTEEGGQVDMDGDGQVSPDEQQFNALTALMKNEVNPTTKQPWTPAEQAKANDVLSKLKKRILKTNGTV